VGEPISDDAARAASPPGPAAAIHLRQRYERLLAERGFQSDPSQAAALLRLEDLRGRLLNAEHTPRAWLARWLSGASARFQVTPVRGLYLWGGVGRGKTWLMDLFFASLPFAAKRRRHFHRFMQDVHARLTALAHEPAPLERVAGALAVEAHVLCLDELQVTDIGDAMILGGLFEGLFRRGVTLVTTSNTPPEELYRDGLQRERFLPAIRLLERHLEVLHVDGGTDHRLRHLTQAGTYLPAGAPDTPVRLAALFDSLSGHDGQLGGVVEIEGRNIPVVGVGGGAVWFEFAALCSGPRSQNDYIDIARSFQSVLVSGVPVMDARRDDEARRFIALIDELYDHNVNLVLSAYAPPAGLYQGERLSVAFARTVSRLAEMQSEEYLAREHIA
jgi:cell division protein ZapE